jgi:magnesium chelatase family protein
MFDRFDIQIDVPAVTVEELQSPMETEPSAKIMARIGAAADVQMERFRGSKNRRNAAMAHGDVVAFCELGADASSILAKAMEQLALSARAYDKILKVGRTIADLDGEEKISTHHILEAIQYRSLDRN